MVRPTNNWSAHPTTGRDISTIYSPAEAYERQQHERTQQAKQRKEDEGLDTARRTSVCPICRTVIRPGDAVVQVRFADGRAPQVGHPDCSPARDTAVTRQGKSQRETT